jgi:protein SCO1/2
MPQIIKANPNVPNLEFRNQEGKSVRLVDLKGKPVLMSFVYTRCPMPTMCPLTTKQFVAVQKSLKAEERDKVALVLISFDPEYDTPAVLKKYGEAYGVDWSNLQMWTGSKQNVFDLTDSFNMWYKEESGDYAHRTFSVLLNAEGKYVTDLRGADWDVAGAVELLRSLMSS